MRYELRVDSGERRITESQGHETLTPQTCTHQRAWSNSPRSGHGLFRTACNAREAPAKAIPSLWVKNTPRGCNTAAGAAGSRATTGEKSRPSPRKQQNMPPKRLRQPSCISAAYLPLAASLSRSPSNKRARVAHASRTPTTQYPLPAS